MNAFQDYWDQCAAAGPAKRAATTFGESPPMLKVLAREDLGNNAWKPLYLIIIDGLLNGNVVCERA